MLCTFHRNLKKLAKQDKKKSKCDENMFELFRLSLKIIIVSRTTLVLALGNSRSLNPQDLILCQQNSTASKAEVVCLNSAWNPESADLIFLRPVLK